jgi:protocatechuate 3,4-dioxygenase beta subunit
MKPFSRCCCALLCWLLTAFAQSAISQTASPQMTSPQKTNTQTASNQMAQGDGTITGRVLDPAGEPVAGLRVMLQGNVGNRDARYEAKTDEHGAVRFTRLKPLKYFFSCQIPAGLVDEVEGHAHQALYLGDHFTVQLIHGGVITGRVTDAQGEPVTGIQVYARRVLTLAGEAVREEFSAMRYTDDRGVIGSSGCGQATIWCVPARMSL